MNPFPFLELKEWFLQNRRSFPWRETLSPYAVWISEVMLQQTQATVVVPYFQKWMATFPTIQALAEAPLERVIKEWEGLGYYQRARHVHAAAHFIVTHYGGELPDDSILLQAIQGLGPYTTGAILSFAFHKKAAAVDGNVLRVMSRFFAIDEEIDRPCTRKKIEQITQTLLPDHEPWVTMEGLIELGALVCTKEPRCSLCPLKKGCLSFRNDLQTLLPKRRPRPSSTPLKRFVAVITYKESYLVERREKGEVMADLYEFPYTEIEMEVSDLKHHFETQLGLQLSIKTPLRPVKHTFTRFRVELFPYLFEAHVGDAHNCWKSKENLHKLPFSSGHRRIMQQL